MRPRPLSEETKAKLVEWLHGVVKLVETGEVTCVAAFLQHQSGGGICSLKGELVSSDAIESLRRMQEQIVSEARREKAAN